MIVKALDLSTYEYIDVNVVNVYRNKKLDIAHIAIEEMSTSGEVIALKRYGKNTYRAAGYELLINENELEGVEV